MTFNVRCWKRRLVVLAIATSLPSGCGMGGSDRSAAIVCPPVVEYGADLQAAAAAEVEKLPETEGHITKLKLVKRQMYGRAKLDLLRARLLGAA